MLSSTFEFIFVASSNSHIIFCFCNFIIAILLLSGFQSSPEDNTTNLDHDMTKRKEAQGNPKAKQFHKDMNLHYEVSKMGTCVTSQEMQTFSTSSDTSTIKVLCDISQDNKYGAYNNAARLQYHEFVNFKQSHHQYTGFECENIEEANTNGTIDRQMDTCVRSEEMHTFPALSDTSIIKVSRDINQEKRNGAYDDVARFQHHESTSGKQSHHQDTSFKCENVEKASANVTIDTKMYLAQTRKEIDDNDFEKSDEKEEDELRKRIEDFIEKINRGWRAEKLGICYQSQ
ncbi:hypothetical protein FXO38_26554 [Capsicum annuum]|nr:hypothetical protein FXO38_26554 [Capsicum annuum]KAF3633870.1 hypothetical protein FXO37_26814 [Capsicum annuum]